MTRDPDFKRRAGLSATAGLSCFVASRCVVANEKAVDGAYNDVIVYVTVIRMAFTLTDKHRVDCRLSTLV